MAKLTVVIPYYQKEPGILRRALASVFAQTLEDFHVLVIDDESPYPIADELAGLAQEERERITVIRQPNGGPGGARNTGLDNVPADSDFVAFLDSDDVWTPDHLLNAYQSMTRFDADCYWASITGGDAFYYHFGVADLEKSETVTRLSESPLVVELPELQDVMLKNWSFLHMSCMVIGRKLFEKVRFEATLKLAAEDVLFFCDCVLASKRVVLCDAAGAVRGEGLNIFHSIDNDSPQFLKQQFNTWVALDTLEGRYRNRPKAMEAIRSYKHTARRQALWSQARRIKRRKLPQFDLLARWLWRDPRLIGSAAELAVGKLSR
ncbi:succinoglycan biosynthesis protein exow [Sinorhizobium meliloti]|jgi:succinoglycan biosynthesis protein ExoW|uniref:Succinoglycan biosynthesis protein ExoW n=5 Tax=Sinorhizobium TaxID=28105 RepID=EXOW_RHIME|nr:MULTISPECIES: succinoglycan biosynthesis glycosyltransferase ExoW [Sinorhizobium]P33702.2 RecName: Full=Succinoglycan biosynthesis protein ExoW [Sinorhizobium meliloti 1021]TWB05430.1 succinoglycan biosynthesis protein ExoW [Ensifer sp. SEMIA 134]TWB41402.1 succinoglycan biosynthesis protein ExoW [Ensifer sp. SEMIA 135]AEG07907.1 glycosyl transferase family 2 [Sinorhizobium meliloti BL225C]AEG56307.1 glycosyl transferase family 2 [Sinorhizobium meliloti AK83]AGA10630.1 Glycosyltransferases